MPPWADGTCLPGGQTDGACNAPSAGRPARRRGGFGEITDKALKLYLALGSPRKAKHERVKMEAPVPEVELQAWGGAE